MFVERLTQAEVEHIIGFSVSLRHNATGIITPCCLHGDAPWQNIAGCHARIPREILIGFSNDGLFIYCIFKTVELVVEEIDRGGEVEFLPQTVLAYNLESGRVGTCDILRGGVNNIATIIAYALNDIFCGAVVTRERKCVFFPVFNIVQFIGVGVLGGEVGVTERDVCSTLFHYLTSLSYT